MSTGERPPAVGIIMGSDSDLSTMVRADDALRESGLQPLQDFEARVISAHRTPERMADYAHGAESSGRKVIIAGAGGSAHLPGMVSSETTLPVLGVAITKAPDVMNRALGSLIGMPEGKPLATFQGRIGAYNAGLFAASILALDPQNEFRVGVVASSDEDLELMQDVSRALRALGLQSDRDFAETVLSTEDDIVNYMAARKDSSLGMVIAASSYRAEMLPYDLSIQDSGLPIMGVSLPRNPDVMSGSLDILVNANEGEPVAAFQGPAGAFNAGLMAARILALNNPAVRTAYQEYDTDLGLTVVAKDAILRELGSEAYMALSPDDLAARIAAEIDATSGTEQQ